MSLLAALDIVLEERALAERPRLELVWSGPLSTAPQTRSTAVVLSELFEQAQHRVMVAGYVFTRGDRILQPLHAALVRGASCRMFIDIPGAASSVEQIASYASAAVREFVESNWPFGPPHAFAIRLEGHFHALVGQGAFIEAR